MWKLRWRIFQGLLRFIADIPERWAWTDIAASFEAKRYEIGKPVLFV